MGTARPAGWVALGSRGGQEACLSVECPDRRAAENAIWRKSIGGCWPGGVDRCSGLLSTTCESGGSGRTGQRRRVQLCLADMAGASCHGCHSRAAVALPGGSASANAEISPTPNPIDNHRIRRFDGSRAQAPRVTAAVTVRVVHKSLLQSLGFSPLSAFVRMPASPVRRFRSTPPIGVVTCGLEFAVDGRFEGEIIRTISIMDGWPSGLRHRS